ncbi:MAG: hypothetical protein E7407_01840 [Ruminococcaceae bacterium]|nr:hypothetical protein [Oscillospiraceae bacterium]
MMFMNSDLLKSEYNIKESAVRLMNMAEADMKDRFNDIDETASVNTLRVLSAFKRAGVSEMHLGSTTGYGYDDVGRDTLDKIYADVFGTESALVRHNIVSGTHALSSCFFGLLRPGDTLLSVTGKPYDTLEEVIGIRGNASGSLKDWGINYREVDLLPDGSADLKKIAEEMTDDVKLVTIQRSKGYAWRKSLSVSDIALIIECVKRKNPNTLCMVDNCYGEFVEKIEPTNVGADVIAGSLIKNPGGGLSLSGGYIAGKKDAIEKISYHLTAPGIGSEVGASLGMNRNMYQGLFMAPHTVAQSVKTAILAARMLELAGYSVCPASDESRHDIIQAVKLLNKEKLCAFCAGIQRGAPIDSFVTPVPWDMPGYNEQVIMAAGAFVSGASIEISADAPIKEPFIAYMQGGLTYESGKIAVLCAVSDILDK